MRVCWPGPVSSLPAASQTTASLHFSPPAGYPDFELRPGGADVAVDSSNLQEYLSAVVDATLGGGVRPQLEAFDLRGLARTLDDVG